MIDGVAPCLIEVATGKTLQTTMCDLTARQAKAFKGWAFDWAKEFKPGRFVKKLTLTTDTVAQGAISYEIDRVQRAIYVALVESAPSNRGSNGALKGVGAHLFAYAGKVAYENGFDYIYFESKTRLMKYYQQLLGAYGTGLGGRMIVDGEDLQKLVENYYGRER